ncbi:peroxisomal membrane protein PMP34-like [Carlito syrichta]|uniref:Peroxisomal membrane protein PMP34-like n=1 Tax=Carlito syrichta TaxID=1868482 RepID=A0A1U7T2B9_CARSF|nr:peroxisomal membrane protein PMP34-like [Carlito syrichta]
MGRGGGLGTDTLPDLQACSSPREENQILIKEQALSPPLGRPELGLGSLFIFFLLFLQFGRHRLNPENRTLGSLRNVLYLLHQRVRRFGIMGLYKGLEAKLLQTVLTAALMFLVYEKLTAATFTVMGLKSVRKP